jgi:hypothetical protein
MGALIPFFYYDLLARIVPGACTLATLLVIRDDFPRSWISELGGAEGWKAVVVPLALGGISYALGVVYEVMDYAPPFNWGRWYEDNRAFEVACNRFRETSPNAEKLSDVDRKRFGTGLWERLTLEAARKTDMSLVFAHCHRYQAEAKMFLHLVYPGILFAFLSFERARFWQGVLAVPVILLCCYVGYRRDERRWWQVLSFSEQLGWFNPATPVTGERNSAPSQEH